MSIDIIRTKLKQQYKARDLLGIEMQKSLAQYIMELQGEKGIYIGDHAIVRYLERVKGVVFTNSELTDEKKVAEYTALTGMYIGYIREEMLDLAADRCILNKRLGYYDTGKGYAYIIKELCVVTVLLNEI